MTPSTIIGLIIIAAIVTLIIRGMIKDHKEGTCHCGSSCSSCAGGCNHSSKTNN